MALHTRNFLPVFVLALATASSIALSSAAAKKVPLTLYYESLCPYCSGFIVNYLPRIFKNGLLEIVDLKLVPYGNARIGSNASITCQHGPYECLLNTVEACAISVWPDVHTHFDFVYCVEGLVVNHKYTEWESCFQKIGLDSRQVADCYKSGHGKELELQYAAQTDALEPPHRYVPWVVVDGQPLYEDYENFETYICKAYKGNPPSTCKSQMMKITPQIISDKHGRACYAEKILRSATVSMRRPMEVIDVFFQLLKEHNSRHPGTYPNYFFSKFAFQHYFNVGKADGPVEEGKPTGILLRWLNVNTKNDLIPIYVTSHFHLLIV